MHSWPKSSKACDLKTAYKRRLTKWDGEPAADEFTVATSSQDKTDHKHHERSHVQPGALVCDFFTSPFLIACQSKEARIAATSAPTQPAASMNFNLKTERLRDYPYRPSIYAKDLDLSLSGTDVLGILNNSASKSEHHLWILSHDRDGTLHLNF